VAAIRPILDYCSSLWAHDLPTYLSDQIESIQKRAARIIHNPTIGMPYISALTYADLESLKHRTETQTRELFKNILSPTSCLHSILPPPRDMMMPFWPDSETLTDSPLITEEKNISHSSILALKNYQWSIVEHGHILHDCTECSHCHMLFLHDCIECFDSRRPCCCFYVIV